MIRVACSRSMPKNLGALELLVAFLQAYVFTLLSAIYFGAAVDEGHDVHNHVDDHLPEATHH